jgi:hypothetical protein
VAVIVIPMHGRCFSNLLHLLHRLQQATVGPISVTFVCRWRTDFFLVAFLRLHTETESCPICLRSPNSVSNHIIATECLVAIYTSERRCKDVKLTSGTYCKTEESGLSIDNNSALRDVSSVCSKLQASTQCRMHLSGLLSRYRQKNIQPSKGVQQLSGAIRLSTTSRVGIQQYRCVGAHRRRVPPEADAQGKRGSTQSFSVCVRGSRLRTLSMAPSRSELTRHSTQL